MAKIKVTAGSGRVVPLPSSISTSPGVTLHLLNPGDEIEVDEGDPFVVATLASGDFVRVATPGLTDRIAAKFDTTDDMQASTTDNLSTKKGI